MNISQPIASHIGSVDFGFLTAEEIKALSVKKIVNSTTFDSLLHPIAGGLYDTALGAWGDNSCGTCSLTKYSCPGHAGHIELPVPVYHVTFMDQLLLLLGGQCEFCGYLRLPPVQTALVVYKLRLIHHGLIKEAHELDDMVSTPDWSNEMTNGVNTGAKDSVEDESDSMDIQERMEDFVRRQIRKAKRVDHTSESATGKFEAIAVERRVLVKGFLASIKKAKECGRCQGKSRSFRKDRYSKIFRKSLALNLKAKNVQLGLKASNPLIKALERQKAERMQKREDRQADEGIVADIDDVTSDETDDIESLDAEDGIIAATASEKKSDKARKKGKSQKESDADEYINAQEVHAAISELFDKEKDIFHLVYNPRETRTSKPLLADMFFITHLMVPPTKFRPEARTDGEIVENTDNELYKAILQSCSQLNQIRKDLEAPPSPETRHRDFGDLQNAWVRLQDAVNALIDSDRNPVQGLAGRQIENGIKQKLEKKEGIFRKNMMGKRVNFAARSVISPDPNIETNEIGVPPVFAKKLTYPEPVTNHNFYELKQAVINGVEKWPGAAAVENENGQVINLRTKNLEDRQALANQLLAPSSVNSNGARNKKVHRHLNNGDLVIMNRQPTLHKPSMMAHRTRVLPGEKTIRMHYANCNTYNADFDGDEMNMHFPQNELGRSEALLIADTDHQYLVATSGKPLRGLIQDHISMGVWLTSRDSMFTRGEYYQLLYSCLRPENNHTVTGRITTITPAVVKPRAMWTGKQIVTTILKNIAPNDHPGLTLLGKSQTPGDRWGVGSEEDVVRFQDGELLTGILDKAHLGPTGGGFVHAIYEAYGHVVAGQLLSILGRLLTRLLGMRAFTCGMDDLDLTAEGELTRRTKLLDAKTIGLEVATKYVILDDRPESSEQELHDRLQDVLRDDEKQAGLDSVFNSRTAVLSSEITMSCLPSGLRKPFPKNQMQTMTTSGAKGSAVNANLISCNLGQQVLEGRRVPVMVSGKTLPSFKPFDTQVRAGGYITDRFLTGVKPQEYYFHAMAGREGLIDTAVKTSRSGYLQRCLIKGMEGLKAQYDSSVRDADGSMVQFLYGEDGLDVTKQKHLTDFKFIAENYLSVVAQLNMREEFAKLKDIGASEYNKSTVKAVRKTGDIGIKDPVLALYNPGAVFGSISESFTAMSRRYCDENPHNLIKDKKNIEKTAKSVMSKRTFQTLIDTKYMKSVVDPGEAVGIVAGQSIGEPSTQMTLNTFHLAGHSAKNVTLGIPRLREIVMTASRFISTPTMTLPLIGELDESAGNRFAKLVTKLTLAEVVDSVSITERIGRGTGYETAKIYDIRLDLFPSDECMETYAIDTSDVLRAIEMELIPELIRAMKKEFTRKGDGKLVKASESLPDVGKSSGKVKDGQSQPEAEQEGGDDDMDDDGDDDATNNKQKQNQTEATSYDAPDEEEETIARSAQRQSSPGTETEDEGIGHSPSEAAHSEAESNGDSDGDREEMDIKGVADRIRDKNAYVTHFAFDQQRGSWCEIILEYDVAVAKILVLPMLESRLHQTVIKSIPGIGSATWSREKVPGSDEVENLVITQGVNLKAMHHYQSIINPHKILTNDIGAMLEHYGVEAARSTIIREMDAVFQSHSIKVDMRHLNLIADFMTRGGEFSPFNRMGMRDAVSPFMKMSFETTLQFVASAVLAGDWDTLDGPSARIVAGRLSKVGTGSFDILVPLNEQKKAKERDAMKINGK
ncbi:MAG: hypothetical protein Q9219_004000 [cf. Caloplaca sp. 3 TL-2023]